MKLLHVFKNYNPGTPNSRLYVKNLAKSVTEKDLKHIFGRYVIWTCDDEKNKYAYIYTGAYVLKERMRSYQC